MIFAFFVKSSGKFLSRKNMLYKKSEIVFNMVEKLEILVAQVHELIEKIRTNSCAVIWYCTYVCTMSLESDLVGILVLKNIL